MSLDPNATFDITYRPGVEAPILGPDGSNGTTRTAYAPTPGLGESSQATIKMRLPWEKIF
jgi:hypothetical protein